MGKHIDNKKEELVCRLYLEGKYYKDICKDNNLKVDTFYSILKRNKIKTRGKITQKNNTIKYCKVCGVELTDDNWYPSYKKDNQYTCKKCLQKYNREHVLGQRNGDSIRCTKRSHTLKCELCNREVTKTIYHHWNDLYYENGLWVCWWCHGFVEGIERGLGKEHIDKYIELKGKVESKSL